LNRLADGFDPATSAFDGEDVSQSWRQMVFVRHPVVFSRQAGASGMPADGKALPVGYDGIAADYDGIAAGYAGIAADYDGFAAEEKGLPVEHAGMPAEYPGEAAEHAGMPVAYECYPAEQDREPVGALGFTKLPTGYLQARLQREEAANAAWAVDAAHFGTAAGEESQVEA
jgi:hypothetical protein